MRGKSTKKLSILVVNGLKKKLFEESEKASSRKHRIFSDTESSQSEAEENKDDKIENEEGEQEALQKNNTDKENDWQDDAGNEDEQLKSNEVLSFEEQVLAILTKATNDVRALIEERGAVIRNPEKVYLAPGVMINGNVLHDIKRIARKDPKIMTRRILSTFIGDENLSEMSATTVPQKVLHAIERYVNSSLKPSKQLKMTEFKRCVTNYCTYLRDKKKKANEKSNQKKSNCLQETKGKAYKKLDQLKIKKIEEISHKFNIIRNQNSIDKKISDSEKKGSE